MKGKFSDFKAQSNMSWKKENVQQNKYMETGVIVWDKTLRNWLKKYCLENWSNVVTDRDK